MSKLVSKHKSRRFRRFLKATVAVSALEYAILVGIVATAIGVGIAAFGDSISAVLTSLGTDLEGASRPTVDLSAPAPGP